MIKLQNVTKVYKEGARPALDDVTVNIERGEFVFLVGSSGSGKSTLLSLILRSERANSGVIQVAGRNLNELTNWRVPRYRQQIGVVFQNFRLLRNKTVYENVAFALKVIGKPKRTIQTLVAEALKIVGLEGKEDRLPDQLSGGEQQRVAIARAFVNRPLIILADEPTGNLDPTTSADIMSVFEMISKMGTTILMATHSEDIVNSMRKRVIELHHGKLIRDEADARYISRLDNEELDGVSAPAADLTPAELDPAYAGEGDGGAAATATVTQVDPAFAGKGEGVPATPSPGIDFADAQAVVNPSGLDPAFAGKGAQVDPSYAGKVGAAVENSTVRIPKMTRKVSAKLATSTEVREPEGFETTDEVPDIYTAYNTEPAPLFDTGAFDATGLRKGPPTGDYVPADTKGGN